MADMVEGIAADTITEEFIDSCLTASEHAADIEAAIMKVAVLIARPGDWQLRQDIIQLTTIGAERFLKHFPIDFDDLVSFRQEFEDENGLAYRWVYQMRASMNGRVVFAEGRCSSTSFVNNDEEAEDGKVDEGGVMGAALAMAQSSGIKALLGFRKVRAVDLFKAAEDAAGIDVEKFKLDCIKPIKGLGS